MAIGNLGKSIKVTPEGGLAVQLINKTGSPSVKGELVNTTGSLDNSVNLVAADEDEIIGAFYEDGIADGELAWVVFAGIADVMLEDSTIATRGYWCRTSITQAGRVDITNADPPGGGIPQADIHFREVGHCLQSVASGTDKLARIIMHFN